MGRLPHCVLPNWIHSLCIALTYYATHVFVFAFLCACRAKVWVHLLCARFSGGVMASVFRTIASVICVHKDRKCYFCKKKGAIVKCMNRE